MTEEAVLVSAVRTAVGKFGGSLKGMVAFDTDEHVKGETTAQSLGSLKPVFRKDGSVTAGNASGINDGAAALVLATASAAKAMGPRPRARILGWGHAGVDRSTMGIGSVEAVPIVLKRAGLTLDQVNVIESIEAIAAQSCAVAKELGFDPDPTNVNGSGTSFSDPVGAADAIITVKLLHELERSGGRYGLATMCIGGGQGIALVIKRLQGKEKPTCSSPS